MYQQSDLKYVNLFQIDIFTHKNFTQLVKKKYLNILMLSDNFVDKQKKFCNQSVIDCWTSVTWRHLSFDVFRSDSELSRRWPMQCSSVAVFQCCTVPMLQCSCRTACDSGCCVARDNGEQLDVLPSATFILHIAMILQCTPTPKYG